MLFGVRGRPACHVGSSHGACVAAWEPEEERRSSFVRSPVQHLLIRLLFAERGAARLTPTYALDGFERRMLFRLSLFIGPRVQFPLPGSIIPGSPDKMADKPPANAWEPSPAYANRRPEVWRRFKFVA